METTNISLSRGVFEAPHTSKPIYHLPVKSTEKPLDVVSKELQYIRLGYINYPDVEKVLEDIGTEYYRITSEERKAIPRYPTYI